MGIQYRILIARSGLPCLPPPPAPHRAAPSTARQPERTLLYRTVQAHLTTWLALQEDGAGASAPAVTEREFRRYLECGILAYGFARARCAECGHDFLVAHSCKYRGVCPKCGGEMKIIAFITEAVAIREILGHLGVPTSPPALKPARGPPL